MSSFQKFLNFLRRKKPKNDSNQDDDSEDLDLNPGRDGLKLASSCKDISSKTIQNDEIKTKNENKFTRFKSRIFT